MKESATGNWIVAAPVDFPNKEQDVQNRHHIHTVEYILPDCPVQKSYRVRLVNEKNGNTSDATTYSFLMDLATATVPDAKTKYQFICGDGPWEKLYPSASTAKFEGDNIYDANDWQISGSAAYVDNTDYYDALDINLGQITLHNKVYSASGSAGFSPEDAYNAQQNEYNGGIFYYDFPDVKCMENFTPYGTMVFNRLSIEAPLATLGTVVNPDDLVCPQQMACSVPGVTYYAVPTILDNFPLNVGSVKSVKYYYVENGMDYENTRMTDTDPFDIPGLEDFINKKVCYYHLWNDNNIAETRNYKIVYIVEQDVPDVDNPGQLIKQECEIVQFFTVAPVAFEQLSPELKNRYELLKQTIEALALATGIPLSEACDIVMGVLLGPFGRPESESVDFVYSSDELRAKLRHLELEYIFGDDGKKKYKLGILQNGIYIGKFKNRTIRKMTSLEGKYEIGVYWDEKLVQRIPITLFKDNSIFRYPVIENTFGIQNASILWSRLTEDKKNKENLKYFFNDTSKELRQYDISMEIDKIQSKSDKEYREEPIIFPNPTESKLNIKVLETQKIESVQIFSLDGRMVQSFGNLYNDQRIITLELLHGLETGNYLVHIVFKSGETCVKKILIN